MTEKHTETQPDNAENFAASRHEAGDRAFVAHQHFADFVQRHPFVSDRPELAALAGAVDEAMADLYHRLFGELRYRAGLW